MHTQPPAPTGLVGAAIGASGTDTSEPSRAQTLWRKVSATAMKLGELAAAQGAVSMFPLVFAVLCARNLGPAQYGVISFYTALTAFLCLFVEFGFDSIGVREVHSSAQRAHPEQVLWNVALAKLIICVPTCAVTVSALLATRSSSEASLSFAAALYLLAFALEPSWYLRALELTRPALMVAAISRLAGVGVLVAVVTAEDDLAAAMWTYTFVAWASTAIGWALMHRLHVLGKPRFDAQHLRALFKSGSELVMGNLSGASISNGGIAVLGAIADPVVTGTANMALRVRSAALGALAPILQLGFVRLSTVFGKDRRAAVGFGRRLFYLLMAATVVLALVIIACADQIAALAYGLPQPPAAAGSVVRLLAASLPVHVAALLFGLQSLTLFEKERAYVVIHVIACALFFGLMLSFDAHTSLHYGWALVAAESWIFLGTGLHLRKAVKAL